MKQYSPTLFSQRRRTESKSWQDRQKKKWTGIQAMEKKTERPKRLKMEGQR